MATSGKSSPSATPASPRSSLCRCFVYDGRALVGVARLVELSRGHKKIILYAVPGKEPFYRRFGFWRMRTAMAIFADQPLAAQRGYLDET